MVLDDIVLLHDGWLYEHEALARSTGHFGGCTDAEAMAHAWRRWGIAALDRIDGDFALAVWERASSTLWLMRDRVGVRPLFWSQRGPRVAFASELPALYALDWISRSPDPDRLAEYLSFNTVHAPRTLVRDIQQVEPAHYVRIDTSSVVTRSYWTPPYAPVGTRRPRDAVLVRQLQEAVDASVRKRVPHDVPTGLYFSGGLGSTAIAAAAPELPTFHISIAEDPHPESPFAGRVASLLGLTHRELTVGTADLAAAFTDTVTALGQPVGSPAAVLQLLLARAARRDVRVVLSGEGSVELFGGRMLDAVTSATRAARLLGHLPRPLRGVIGAAGGDRARTLSKPSWLLELGLGGQELFTANERTRLLRDPVIARPDVRQAVLAPFYADLETDPFNVVLHGYLRSLLSEGSLVRADRTAAATGLDIRFPLLDRAVVERAAALPGSAKLKRVAGSLHTRWPLRALVSGVLPRGLANRPKRGLAAPLDRWLAGPGRLFFEDRYARLCRDPLGLWRPEALAGLRHGLGKERGAGARLWSLFLLDAWLDGRAG